MKNHLSVILESARIQIPIDKDVSSIQVKADINENKTDIQNENNPRMSLHTNSFHELHVSVDW